MKTKVNNYSYLTIATKEDFSDTAKEGEGGGVGWEQAGTLSWFKKNRSNKRKETFFS